jgi:ABC transporter substrate binding protein
MYLFRRSAIHLLSTSVLLMAFFGTPEALESNATPLQSIYMIKQLIPQAKTIGLMWKQTDENGSGVMDQIKRASATLGVKIVMADVENITDVAAQFRDLADSYHVEALWIIHNSDVLSSSTARGFLIKNAALQGIPLFAPDHDWVSAGACAAVVTDGGSTKLYVNQKTLNALGLKVPESDAPVTQVLANN